MHAYRNTFFRLSLFFSPQKYILFLSIIAAVHWQRACLWYCEYVKKISSHLPLHTIHNSRSGCCRSDIYSFFLLFFFISLIYTISFSRVRYLTSMSSLSIFLSFIFCENFKSLSLFISGTFSLICPASPNAFPLTACTQHTVAKGRTNIELREQFILADGVSQTMTAFRSKPSPTSTLQRTQISSANTGPITKVRKRGQVRLDMRRSTHSTLFLFFYR